MTILNPLLVSSILCTPLYIKSMEELPKMPALGDHRSQGFVAQSDHDLEDNVPLNQASTRLPIAADRARWQQEAENSMKELCALFTEAFEADDSELWKQFLPACEAHIAAYRGITPFDFIKLMKNCALLFLGNKASAEQESFKKELAQLMAQYFSERDRSKKQEIHEHIKLRQMAKNKAIASATHAIDFVQKGKITREISQSLEILFYNLCKAIGLENKENITIASRHIEFLEPAIERLMPGVMAFKKAFVDFICSIEALSSLNPQEGIACVKKAFEYLAQREKKREEWITFVALCDVAIEKWGKQQEFLSMQRQALKNLRNIR